MDNRFREPGRYARELSGFAMNSPTSPPPPPPTWLKEDDDDQVDQDAKLVRDDPYPEDVTEYVWVSILVTRNHVSLRFMPVRANTEED